LQYPPNFKLPLSFFSFSQPSHPLLSTSLNYRVFPRPASCDTRCFVIPRLGQIDSFNSRQK
jgi:hypothetical protein